MTKHAIERADERYHTKLSYRDIKDVEIDIKAGRHFETFDRDDNHCKLIILNISKIGANVPVIYDPIAKKVVTVLPRKAMMKKYFGWDMSRRKRAPTREKVLRRR